MEISRKKLANKQFHRRVSRSGPLSGRMHVYSDKIIDIKQSPTIARIQYGLDETLKAKHGFLPVSTKFMQYGYSSTSAQGALARHFLDNMGVFQSNQSKDFSLLSCAANRPEQSNPYISVDADFGELVPGPITIQENFPDPTDPIYVIEKPIITGKDYGFEKENITGNRVIQKDLSKVASGIVSINISKRFPGTNKYFEDNIPPTIEWAPRNLQKIYTGKPKAENLQGKLDVYDPNKPTTLSRMIIEELKQNPSINYGIYTDIRQASKSVAQSPATARKKVYRKLF